MTETATPTPTMNPANAASERDDKGRFGKGNRGGPGNPFARQTAKLRQAMLNSVTEDDIAQVMHSLKQQAIDGDRAAAKLLLSYTVGKPTQAVDPDTLDQHEFQTIRNNHVQSAEDIVRVIQGMPIEALLMIFHATLPALFASKMQTAAQVFAPPPPEEAEEEEEEATDTEEKIIRVDENIPDWMREIAERDRVETPKQPEQVPAANETPRMNSELLRLLLARMGGMLNLHGEEPMTNGRNGAGEQGSPPASSRCQTGLTDEPGQEDACPGREQPMSNGCNGHSLSGSR